METCNPQGLISLPRRVCENIVEKLQGQAKYPWRRHGEVEREPRKGKIMTAESKSIFSFRRLQLFAKLHLVPVCETQPSEMWPYPSFTEGVA